MTAKISRNWKRIQATSLRHALELCKEHAQQRHNLSVERIAERLGVTDHWTIYKWIQTGRIPANMILPYEAACGIDFVTRFLASSGGKLLIAMPTGRDLLQGDVIALHSDFATALQHLTDFYDSKRDPAAALAALQHHLENVAFHHANVTKHSTPELEF